MNIEEVTKNLTAAQTAGMKNLNTIIEGWGSKWGYAKKPLIAAALYRKGLLTRMQQGQNPIHEPASKWYEYRITDEGRAVVEYLKGIQ